MLINISTDEGPPGWQARDHDMTRLDTGTLPASALVGLPGCDEEEKLFESSPFGRMTETEFEALVIDLKTRGMQCPVTVIVDPGIGGRIHEGNHRIRAAMRANVAVKVEVRDFANAQREGLLFPVWE